MAGAVDLSGLKQRAQQGPPADATTVAPGGTEVTEANFEDEVLARSNQVPVVVLMWSPRSEACLQLAQMLSALAAADDGKWALATVNVDTAPRVAQIFGIEAVPTVVALGAGKPLASFQGPQPAEQLRRWLDSLLSATAGKLSGASEGDEAEHVDPALEQARQQLDAGDFAAAQASYQAILDGDPNHVEAKAAVRQLIFLQRATAQRPDAVAVADAAPGDLEAGLAAADVEMVNQEVKAAFDRLIALVRRTSGDERIAVRTRLIELFEIFEPTDPDVVEARRNLANALY